MKYSFEEKARIELEHRSVSDLIPYALNSRTHSDAQVSQIAASIKEFGFTNPLLIDEQGGIIAGHGRLMAAKKLGLREVPAITLGGLTEAQKKAYVIADNQLALNAGWDMETLRVEIEHLKEVDFDINLLGFDDDFLSLFDEPDAVMPVLNSDDRLPFQKVAFQLHDEQKEVVDAALLLAKCDPLCNQGLNENSSSNGITLICQQWMAANG